jgi:uncharacterized hydrophobic protein (TIGR00271 family)
MSIQPPGTLVALLGLNMDVVLQIHWAVRLATVRKLDILILKRVESHDNRVVEVQLDERQKEEAMVVIREAKRIIDKSHNLRAGPREKTSAGEERDTEIHVIHVRLKLIYFDSLPSLRRALLSELRNSKTKIFTMARAQNPDIPDVEMVKETRLFLRYIPCDIVLCFGLNLEKAMSRILVSTSAEPNGRAALQLGTKLAASARGTLTALYVNPNIGVDAEQVGKRRLERHIKRSLGTRHSAINRRVVVDNNVYHGIRRLWKEGNHDLVVVGMSKFQIEESLSAKLSRGMTVVMVSTNIPFANRFKQFVEEGIRRFVPQIEREDRVALVDRIQSNAIWNFDFVALMVLSTTMAAIGLILNSAAVVIGAMLVAPLMTPLMGLGLAIVQGNLMLARLSLRSIALGLCVSLLGSFLVGLCTPAFEEPTREMLARGGPKILDMFVAFAAGIAASYATSRPILIAALPGVVIAAALLPPIATSGLALSLADFPLAIGALGLFCINMVAIVLASLTSLWIVGFRYFRKTSPWTVKAGSMIMVAVLALGLYISLRPKEYDITKKNSVALLQAVQEKLGANYRLDSLDVTYDELGKQLNVRVVGETPVPEKLATEVRNMVRGYYHLPLRVRLSTKLAIDTDLIESTTKKRVDH